MVSEGETTSNETIKWWIRRNKGLPDDDTSEINLSEIIAMTPNDKTRGKCHIEFQTTEKGLCDLIPMPPNLDGYYRLYHDAPEAMYIAEVTIRSFLELEYSQFLAAIDFLYPEAVFSTEHGVKGEEYDNVVFVISKGWNQYQFETYAPMITGHSSIPKGKEASFERNRNLFYVCCSRPKKRLIFFISVPVEPLFKSFLVELVGEQNFFTYSQYLETSKR